MIEIKIITTDLRYAEQHERNVNDFIRSFSYSNKTLVKIENFVTNPAYAARSPTWTSGGGVYQYNPDIISIITYES